MAAGFWWSADPLSSWHAHCACSRRDPELRMRLGQQGYAAFLEHFTWSNVRTRVQEMKSISRKLLLSRAYVEDPRVTPEPAPSSPGRSLCWRRFLASGLRLSLELRLSRHLPAILFRCPSGPVVQGSLTVTATAIGAIPSRFVGLSYEKLAMSYGYFHASNHNLIALFRHLGAGVLRLGGGFVDRLLWTPSANGTHQQISPTNVKNLAGFLQATGWLCLYASQPRYLDPCFGSRRSCFCRSPLWAKACLVSRSATSLMNTAFTGNYFPGNWTFQDFIDRWDAFRSAILPGRSPMSLSPGRLPAAATILLPGHCPSGRSSLQAGSRC